MKSATEIAFKVLIPAEILSIFHKYDLLNTFLSCFKQKKKKNMEIHASLLNNGFVFVNPFSWPKYIC